MIAIHQLCVMALDPVSWTALAAYPNRSWDQTRVFRIRKHRGGS
jgi:hypothetical protein